MAIPSGGGTEVFCRGHIPAQTSDGTNFTLIDGQVGAIEINDLTEAEEAVDGLHSATLAVSCSVYRAD